MRRCGPASLAAATLLYKVVSVSVLARRVPSKVQPSGAAVVPPNALLVVTNSSMPSPSRTAAGMVTRAVVWFQVAWVAARKVMTSAAAAGEADNPSMANRVSHHGTHCRKRDACSSGRGPGARNHHHCSPPRRPVPNSEATHLVVPRWRT